MHRRNGNDDGSTDPGSLPLTPDRDSRSSVFAVGSYTESYGTFRARGNGVSVICLSGDGGLNCTDSLSLPNPSYLVRSSCQNVLYTTIETLDSRAALVTLEVIPRDGRLRIAGRSHIGGRLPCHLGLHPDGRWISCACYASGRVIVRQISRRGTIETDSGDQVERFGSGPDPLRQDRSHPHATVFSPDGRWLVVPDLGTDEVAAYPFDATVGNLAEPALWRAPSGSGPRTLVFSDCGGFIVLTSELSSEVSLLRWQRGSIREVCRMSSRDPSNSSMSSDNTAAGLRWHPDGIHFGISNRGDNSISIFCVDKSNATLRHRMTIPSGGRKPRDLQFSPCGRWLISANQDSDSCILFEINLASEPSAREVARLAVRSPSCICFLQSRRMPRRGNDMHTDTSRNPSAS